MTPAPTTLNDLHPSTHAAFLELQREGDTLGVKLTLTGGRFVLEGASGMHSISARPDDCDAERLRGHADGFFHWYRKAPTEAAATATQLSLLTQAVA